MEKNEENNMFKYATKELSQDAFICWCINWFNCKDKKGKTEDENRLVEMSEKILNKILENTEINNSDVCINNVDIIRQFNNIDIILTITANTLEQYLVIIEDKKECELNLKQKETFYIDTLFNAIDGDSKNIRENREKLGINAKITKENIIPVFWKTGIWKQTKEELKKEIEPKINKKLICIDGIDTLEIIKNYINKSNIIKDYYTCLEEELRNNNVINIVDEIRKKQEIEVGTIFSKSYYCYNCFLHLIGREYDKDSHSRRGGIALKELNDKIKSKNCFYVSTINLYNADKNQWQNKFENNYNIWLESINNDKLKTDIQYTFLFGKKRNHFGRNQYVFLGLYKLVHIQYEENLRVWERQDKHNKIVSFRKEDILKLMQN